MNFSFDDFFNFFKFYYYFDTILTNVIISKVHYESITFLKFIQKIYDDFH
jgi:hypothetical protein